MSTIDQLVHMANQIARELGSQCSDRPVAATRDHLRQAIGAYLDGGGEQLSETARDAVVLLREHAERAD